MSNVRSTRPNRLRTAVMMIATIAVLGFINVEIAAKNRIVADGATVLLRLAPRDPRSLMQGDYMALRYAMAAQVAAAAEAAKIRDGVAIIELDAHGEARFVAIEHDGVTAPDHQARLRFRKRGESVRLASDAFFFEEGAWETYRGARFGELRVNAAGEAVLVALRDERAKRLGQALHTAPAD